MIGPGFDPSIWVMAAIGLAVGVGVVRTLLWQRAADTSARSSNWRLAGLIALQLSSGLLVYLVLFPPGTVFRTGTLIVVTDGASATIERAKGDVLIALPEAGPVKGARRVPDLATAIRRFPGAARIRVEGKGLVPRDQIVTPMPLVFDPPPRPRGLIDVVLPDPASPGATFSVGGQIGSLASGVVELLDPADVVVDRMRISAGQHFVLKANAREPGLALFGLRLSDQTGARFEQIAVPVETRAQIQPRVLVMAGAPGPETKYLRRWAEDSGIDLRLQIDIGGGLQLGDAPVPLSRAILRDTDLIVIDDRRWTALDSGTRTALASAIDEGLGVLFRPTGPLSVETRRSWAALGISLSGGDDSLPLTLEGKRPAVAPVTADEDTTVNDQPELARRDIIHEGPQAVSLLRDIDGVALASWHARGHGRVGIWTVTDSYALVLTGRSERYGEIWSALFSALARAGDDSRVRIDGLARSGTRLSLCGVNVRASVVGPDGGERAAIIDPATGDRACAAYWPQGSGWHSVRDGQGRETVFYAQPESAGLSLQDYSNREATLALAALTPLDRNVLSTQRTPGSPWPWFIGMLATLALLWWLERRRSVSQNKMTH